MTTTVRATYANGMLTPLEPLDLREGEQVTVSIEGEPLSDGAPSRGGLAAVVEAVRELHESIPPEAWDVLPTDGAQNYKLWGHKTRSV